MLQMLELFAALLSKLAYCVHSRDKDQARRHEGICQDDARRGHGIAG